MSLIRVSSLALAPRLAVGWAEQVVSLVDPDILFGEVPYSASLGVAEENHQVSFFDDCDNAYQRGGVFPPTLRQIREIFNFVRNDARVLVHCHGGMCRSPAVAIGLLIGRGIDPRTAVQTLFAQNLIDNEGSYMEPNELILTYVDRLLGLDNTLVSIVREEMMASPRQREEL